MIGAVSVPRPRHWLAAGAAALALHAAVLLALISAAGSGAAGGSGDGRGGPGSYGVAIAQGPASGAPLGDIGPPPAVAPAAPGDRALAATAAPRPLPAASPPEARTPAEPDRQGAVEGPSPLGPVPAEEAFASSDDAVALRPVAEARTAPESAAPPPLGEAGRPAAMAEASPEPLRTADVRAAAIAHAAPAAPLPQRRPDPPLRSAAPTAAATAPDRAEPPSRPAQTAALPPGHELPDALGSFGSAGGDRGADGVEDTGPPGGVTGEGDGAAAGAAADSGQLQAYAGQLGAWLERHKRYPAAARRRGIEGTAVLWFAVDGDGRVVEHRLTRSAGHALLDDAVHALIARADPMPPIPASLAMERLEIAVPIAFNLR